MAISLSERAGRIVQAEIRAMSIECERVGGINLAQGVCDTEVPLPVRRGAEEAIERGVNSYTRYDGLTELRRAISRKLERVNGMQADPETEITVSAGSTGAFYSACLALLDPGDEVVLFEPYYGYHLNTLLSLEAAPVFVGLRPPGWTLDPEELRRAVGPRTRAIVVNTPANPSGKVFDRGELEEIGRLAVERDLFIFTDEIYEHFLYDGRRHVSPGTIPGLRERTVSIFGLSKTFSITGWRIGYAVSDARWAQTIGYMSDLVYVCAPAPLQAGAAAGIDALEPGFYGELARSYGGKRDRICRALERAGLRPFIPQGAYYVLADASRLPGETSKRKAMHLLLECGVASVPGEAFFRSERGRSLLRFCFAKVDPELEEACRRLERLG